MLEGPIVDLGLAQSCRGFACPQFLDFIVVEHARGVCSAFLI